MHFLGGSVVKNPPANAGDTRSIHGSGRSPREGNGNLLQYSCLRNPVDRERSLVGYSLCGPKRVEHDLATKQQCFTTSDFILRAKESWERSWANKTLSWLARKWVWGQGTRGGWASCWCIPARDSSLFWTNWTWSARGHARVEPRGSWVPVVPSTPLMWYKCLGDCQLTRHEWVPRPSPLAVHLEARPFAYWAEGMGTCGKPEVFLVFSNCVQHPPWTSLLPGLKADIWGLGPLSLGNTKRICSQGFSGPVPGERQVPAENIYWASLADSRWNWSSWVLQGSSELFLILCHIYYCLPVLVFDFLILNFTYYPHIIRMKQVPQFYM